MKKFNSVEFVDSLAEVTSHFDKEVIEKSLLKTLTDFTPSAEYRIYRVLPNTSDKTALALIAYAKDNIVDSLSNEIKEQYLHDSFFDAINLAVETKSVQIVTRTKSNEKTHIIYPALNQSNESFAILIQSCEEVDFEHQRLVHGLLKVYSNYLELIEKARRDKLTQLLNRETLDAEVTRILIRNNTPESGTLKLPSYSDIDSRGDSQNSTYWLGLLDIDFFKKINDTYGHLYGDEILILVARLLENNIRDNDFAFRFGGEEFVIILLDDGFLAAEKAFERIREEINKHPYANVEGLSVSIGVSQITNQATPTDVIEEADKALYYSKENGRNQTQFYKQLVDEKLIAEDLVDESEFSDVDFF